MPLYEFICNKCEKEFEQITAHDETGKYADVECPCCGSTDKQKLFSVCNFQFAQPIGTDRWNNSHDYRFKHNIPKVQKERQMAEQLSHMGADPYGDTSGEDIKLDTGIHDPEVRKGLS